MPQYEVTFWKNNYIYKNTLNIKILTYENKLEPVVRIITYCLSVQLGK